MTSESGKPLGDVSTAFIPKRENASASSRLVPTLTISAHPDVRRVGDRHPLLALTAGRAVLLSRNEPDFTRPGSLIGAPLGDPFVSRKPLRLSLGPEGRVVLTPAEGGAGVVVGGPLEEPLELGVDALERGVPIELAGRVVVLLHLVDQEIEDGADALGMVGQSAGIRRVRRAVERVADLEVPVLIRGETGSGKELVARAIHQKSPRKDGPFVSVNLGAIPRELAAGELFGALKGAFTGAVRDREGYFGAARGGTLFLDEVGEAPPEVQVMLLRVLETGEMFPVGGHTPVATDVRLIAATDADLEAQIRDGRFKAPLHHRLAGYEIRIPPLRERREDIGLVFQHFVREELAAIGELDRLALRDPYADAWLPAPLAALLVRYAWPGNIRQLRNVTRQLVIGSRGLAKLELDPRLAAELEAAALPVVPTTAARPSTPAGAVTTTHVAPEPSRAPEPEPQKRRKAAEVSEAELLDALHAAGWDVKAAADLLGIPRPSIYDLIDRSPNLRTASDLEDGEIEAAHRAHDGDLDRMAAALKVSKRALGRRVRDLGLGRK